jgi:hypothetical protein
MISRKLYGFAGACDSMGSSPFYTNDHTSRIRDLMVTVDSRFIFKDSMLPASRKNYGMKNLHTRLHQICYLRPY